MTDSLRSDGRPFVFDDRGKCPRYVVEDDDEGCVILRNQFTGMFEVVRHTRPYGGEDLRAAHIALIRRERMESKT